MRIASVMGGFSLGQADLLRRAMGHKESDVLLAQRQAFLEGAEKQGVSSEVANHVFDLMVSFCATKSMDLISLIPYVTHG